MKLFQKIKADIDEKIAQEKLNGEKNNFTEKFSIRSLIDGKILVNKSFRKFIPMIFLLLILALFYINNRFAYEGLVRKNNELKEQKADLENTKFVKIKEFTGVSTRSAISQKLKDLGSEVTEPQTPPYTE